jgi:hypothetical protein
MKKIILLLAIISSLYTTAQTIKTQKIDCVFQTNAVYRSIGTLIDLFNMDASTFEKEMKLLNYNVEIGSGFCIKAHESPNYNWVENGGNYFDDCKFLCFSKCPDRLMVYSYNNASNFSLMQFVKELQPYFIKKIGDYNIYNFKYSSVIYHIDIGIRPNDGNSYNEFLRLFKEE